MCENFGFHLKNNTRTPTITLFLLFFRNNVTSLLSPYLKIRINTCNKALVQWEGRRHSNNLKLYKIACSKCQNNLKTLEYSNLKQNFYFYQP